MDTLTKLSLSVLGGLQILSLTIGLNYLHFGWIDDSNKNQRLDIYCILSCIILELGVITELSSQHELLGKALLKVAAHFMNLAFCLLCLIWFQLTVAPFTWRVHTQTSKDHSTGSQLNSDDDNNSMSL